MDCQSATNSQKSAPGKFPKSSHYKEVFFKNKIAATGLLLHGSCALEALALLIGLLCPRSLPLACSLGQNLPLCHELRRGAQKCRAVCLRLALPCDTSSGNFNAEYMYYFKRLNYREYRRCREHFCECVPVLGLPLGFSSLHPQRLAIGTER